MFAESLKEDYDDETDFEEEELGYFGEVEEGVSFFEDGEEWTWEERIAGPVHIDFDNWSVWKAKNEDSKRVYFVVDEDTGFIDWGPVENQTEAQVVLSFLIHTECVPSGRAEDLILGYVVHTYGNAENGAECYKICTDVHAPLSIITCTVNDIFVRRYTLMKKLLALILAAMMILTGVAALAEGETYKVGICNYVDHASLNQIVDNIEAQLAALGEEKGVTFEINYDNCNADASVMQQIIADFIADEVDLPETGCKVQKSTILFACFQSLH